MIYKILIIGGGQLGSRHLQACCLLEEDVDIYVCDPNTKSLQICSERAVQMNPHEGISIKYISDLSLVDKVIDVAIISTNSLVRANVTLDLLSSIDVKSVVFEKFLFPKLEEYDLVKQMLDDTGTRAWVNCPRRMFDFYKNIKNDIDSSFNMLVEGSNWGLGSNAIHFIDLFSYFIDENPIKIDLNGLTQELKKSKREGYLEFFGEMVVHSDNCNCTIVCNDQPIHLPKVTIETERYVFKISESEGVIEKIDKQTDHEIKNLIRIPYQSELSNVFVKDILENDSCDITPYSESMRIHKILLKGLLDKYHRSSDQPFEIT